jgi:phosphopantothenoylcysteine synthetase/decarboxylase
VKVLVTAGGTEEPVDAVRYIGNVSTGATGLAIVKQLKLRGHEVHLLQHQRAERSNHEVRTRSFRTFEDLESHLREVLEEHFFDAIIHAAAVSDYRVSGLTIGGVRKELAPDQKISSGQCLDVHLEPRPKLLDYLKAWSRNPDVVVIAFKLTSGKSQPEERQAVQLLLDSGKADLVAHNDVEAVGSERHMVTVFGIRGIIAETQTKEALAEFLANWLSLRRTI